MIESSISKEKSKIVGWGLFDIEMYLILCWLFFTSIIPAMPKILLSFHISRFIRRFCFLLSIACHSNFNLIPWWDGSPPSKEVLLKASFNKMVEGICWKNEVKIFRIKLYYMQVKKYLGKSIILSKLGKNSVVFCDDLLINHNQKCSFLIYFLLAVLAWQMGMSAKK